MAAKILPFAGGKNARVMPLETIDPEKYGHLYEYARRVVWGGYYKLPGDGGEVELAEGQCIVLFKDGRISIGNATQVEKSLRNELEKNPAPVPARVEKLKQKFRDTALYAALSTGKGYVTFLQFDLGVKNVRKAKPIATFYAPIGVSEKSFDVLSMERLDTRLFDLFNKYGRVEMANAGVNVRICTLKIRDVFEVKSDGFYGKMKEKYKKGDLIIQYEHDDLSLGGPAAQILARLQPVNK